MDTYKGFEQGSSTRGWKELKETVGLLYTQATPGYRYGTEVKRNERAISDAYATARFVELVSTVFESVLPFGNTRPRQRSSLSGSADRAQGPGSR